VRLAGARGGRRKASRFLVGTMLLPVRSFVHEGPEDPDPETATPALATDVVRQDRLGSRCPAILDVKPTEHARDLDRLGQVDIQDEFRRHPLPPGSDRQAAGAVELEAVDDPLIVA
jgi:hypothetical protein